MLVTGALKHIWLLTSPFIALKLEENRTTTNLFIAIVNGDTV
jgi:hypothetical protein